MEVPGTWEFFKRESIDVILRNPTKSQKFVRILGSEIFQDKLEDYKSNKTWEKMDFQKSMDHKFERFFKNPGNLGPWIGKKYAMCIFVAKKNIFGWKILHCGRFLDSVACKKFGSQYSITLIALNLDYLLCCSLQPSNTSQQNTFVSYY